MKRRHQTTGRTNEFNQNSTFRSLIGVCICWMPFACLWDRETLRMERVRFPSAVELMTGEFRRHSPEFHQWRIKDRLERIANSPNDLSLLDDLAVSYEKTGQTDLAIQTMLEKRAIEPGLYETHANLGTFYIHAGEYEKGLVEINTAIEVNPDAHFGREKYQAMLVKYLLQQRTDESIQLPLCDASRSSGHQQLPVGFAKFVIEESLPASVIAKQMNRGIWIYGDTEAAIIDEAITGVLGMMRFGNFNSPVLLEALGDLLIFNTDSPKQLATRAFLKAAYEVEDPEAKTKYREFAKQALSMQAVRGSSQMNLEDLESEFKTEIQAGDRWFKQICQNERDWIEAGLDVEAKYAEVYFEEPAATKNRSRKRQQRLKYFAWFMVAASALCGVFWFFNRMRHPESVKNKPILKP